MANGIFSIGASGLTAAYTALQTTGHNIANVSTPGYKRQSAIQAALVPQFSGAGFVGKGVAVTDIIRNYDALVSSEATSAESRAAEANSQSAYMGKIDSLMGNTSTGVGVAVDSFFNSLQALSTQPSDSASRADFIDQASNLAARISSTADDLSSLKDQAASQLGQSVNSVNDYARQVASLNNSISLAVATGKTPNDLMDQRDTMIRNIATQIGVTTVDQGNGAISVFVANGQSLVVGDKANTLAIGADPNDPGKLTLSLQSANAKVLLGSDGSKMGGGNIAAFLNVHNRDLGQVSAELGRLAVALADPLNAQHAQGVDTQGNSGGALFSLPGPQVFKAVANTGNASLDVSITAAGALKASDYQLNFDGSQYQITRLSDGSKQSFASLPATLDGFTTSLSGGSMAAGDSFTIKPVSMSAAGMTAMIREPSRLALALPVAANASLSNAGTGSVQDLAVSNAADANLRQTVTLTFTGAGSFNVSGTGTGNPGGQSYSAGTAISFNGWSLQMSGTPKAGDVITIQPNGNLSGDNRNALSLAALSSAKLVDGNTPAQDFAATLANVGSSARSAKLDSTSQTKIRDDALASEQSVSGVNLDEEAANMLQYQQAYQAAAKLIATAETVFSALLDLGR
jgi:flagellar hook-associated protein 1 FlgK